MREIGAKRVSTEQELTIKIRRAVWSDSRDLHVWRNDPDTRANSFIIAPVLLEDHEAWFGNSLDRNDRLILIGEYQRQKVGMCRFDKEEGEPWSEISININPKFRRQGLATPLLVAGLRYFRNISEDSVLARVKNSNLASQKVFTRAGFVLREEHTKELEFWF